MNYPMEALQDQSEVRVFINKLFKIREKWETYNKEKQSLPGEVFDKLQSAIIEADKALEETTDCFDDLWLKLRNAEDE